VQLRFAAARVCGAAGLLAKAALGFGGRKRRAERPCMRATEQRRAERASALTKKARAVGGRTGFLSSFAHRRRRSPAHRQATR
ncbi:hypothetical protein AAHH78_36705, partial [Burkholderia pseudomallei]